MNYLLGGQTHVLRSNARSVGHPPSTNRAHIRTRDSAIAGAQKTGKTTQGSCPQGRQTSSKWLIHWAASSVKPRNFNGISLEWRGSGWLCWRWWLFETKSAIWLRAVVRWRWRHFEGERRCKQWRCSRANDVVCADGAGLATGAAFLSTSSKSENACQRQQPGIAISWNGPDLK